METRAGNYYVSKRHSPFMMMSADVNTEVPVAAPVGLVVLVLPRLPKKKSKKEEEELLLNLVVLSRHDPSALMSRYCDEVFAKRVIECGVSLPTPLPPPDAMAPAQAACTQQKHPKRSGNKDGGAQVRRVAPRPTCENVLLL